MRALADRHFARHAKWKRDRDGIAQSGVSEDRNDLADHRLLDLTPGPASRGPSLSCEEEDAQPHARCIFLNAFNNPLNIDFYAQFCHSPPRGSARFRLEVSGQRPEGRSDFL